MARPNYFSDDDFAAIVNASDDRMDAAIMVCETMKDKHPDRTPEDWMGYVASRASRLRKAGMDIKMFPRGRPRKVVPVEEPTPTEETTEVATEEAATG